jgi:ribonuclease-3
MVYCTLLIITIPPYNNALLQRIGIWENRFTLALPPAQKNDHTSAWRELWSRFAAEEQALGRLETMLAYTFRDRTLLYEALTHRSAVFLPKSAGAKKKSLAQKNSAISTLPWNERIEFLGDTVLSLVISSVLWQRPEKFSEGELSRLRANLVSAARLAEIARTIALQEVLLVGKSVKKDAPSLHESMLADGVEALFGAIYIDGGFAAAQKVITGLFAPYLQQSLSQLDSDYKTSLQEWAQEHLGEKPVYLLEREEGPDHAKEFCVSVLLQQKTIGRGKGVSKKQASQEAAFFALQHLADGVLKKKRKIS